MFDYKRLFGIAAILFGIGFILQSIMPAKANPTGPSVGYGSNPWKSFYVESPGTLFSTSSSEVFIITTMISGGGTCYFYIDGVRAIHQDMTQRQYGTSAARSLHYVVEPSSTISIDGQSCNFGFYLDGYYTQP
jgi:hypothetical protein